MTTLANDRMVFIHIPKTGGTWGTWAMQSAGVKFEKIGDTHHLMKEELEIGDRFAFAFVRDPFTWYSSVWKYHRSNPLSHWEPFSQWIELDFPDFLEQVVENCPGYLSEYYPRFVGPPDREINFIGRYERLVDDLVVALRLAGQDFDEKVIRTMPPINRSLSEDDEEVVVAQCSSDLIARLAETEQEIYERFYSGEDSPSPAWTLRTTP
jgi:hypothetical protein